MSTGMRLLSDVARGTLEHSLPPAFGAFQVVEREDMEAADIRGRMSEALLEPADDGIRVEVAALRPPEPAPSRWEGGGQGRG